MSSGHAAGAGDMVDRTSTYYAPWTIVSSEDKDARVTALRTMCERLEAAV